MGSIFILISLLFYVNTQKLTIEDSGLVNFGENDNAMVFYIQVKEDGPTSSRIYVQTAECCETMSEDETDCGTIHLIGGDMDIVPYGTSRNLTLYYPTLYGYNRHGACLVDIFYNANNTKLRHRIDFDTVIRSDFVPNGLEPWYNPSEITPCLTLDLDPFNSCEPVICQAKYNGLRNYFNREVGRCDKPAVCDEGTVYIPISNTCRDIDPPVNDDDLIAVTEELPISDKDDVQVEVICHRGRPEMGTCICETGWQTVRSDDSSVGTLHMCNVPCPGNIFSSPYILISFHTFDLIFGALIAGFIVLIIIFWDKQYMKRQVDCYNDSTNVIYFQNIHHPPL